MRVLLAVDGSRYTSMSLVTLQALKLGQQTQVTITTVIPELTFLGGLTLEKVKSTLIGRPTHKAEEKAASKILQTPVAVLKETGVAVESRVSRGKPAEEILKQADEIQADLVVIGAKGLSDSDRFPLGSVAQKVMKYANTSVLIVREKTRRMRRVLLAVDGSKPSEAAASFLLELPLPSHSRVLVVTCLESHIAALVKTPTLSLERNRKIIEQLQLVEEEVARALIDKTEGRFRRRGYNTETLLLRGYPSEEILAVSETMPPDLIVVGAKGLSGVEAFLLGSVTVRIARFSRYSVLIVRQRRR